MTECASCIATHRPVCAARAQLVGQIALHPVRSGPSTLPRRNAFYYASRWFGTYISTPDRKRFQRVVRRPGQRRITQSVWWFAPVKSSYPSSRDARSRFRVGHHLSFIKRTEISRPARPRSIAAKASSRVPATTARRTGNRSTQVRSITALRPVLRSKLIFWREPGRNSWRGIAHRSISHWSKV